jgi:glyoxylase-like metal-dependent hydrolase (beta-lactamase superfamily II)
MRTPWPSRFIFGDAPITSFSEISLGGILIQHPEGYVLVDNGLSLGPGFEYTDQIMTAAEGYKFIAGTFLKSFGDKIPFLKTVIKDEYLDMLKAVKTPLRIKPSVSSQLKTHGIKLDDIKHIVFTHLHYDHVGDISQFKRARVWVSQKEMRAAQHPLAFFNGYNPLIAQWDYRTERILDPLVIKPEVAPFSIVKDLFGDGKVLILSTPGHTQGSLSVLVRDEDKKYYTTKDER